MWNLLHPCLGPPPPRGRWTDAEWGGTSRRRRQFVVRVVIISRSSTFSFLIRVFTSKVIRLPLCEMQVGSLTSSLLLLPCTAAWGNSRCAILTEVPFLSSAIVALQLASWSNVTSSPPPPPSQLPTIPVNGPFLVTKDDHADDDLDNIGRHWVDGGREGACEIKGVQQDIIRWESKGKETGTPTKLIGQAIVGQSMINWVLI